jgi:folate-dependent phosphoribosylglycinamide formyltransferase PurN
MQKKIVIIGSLGSDLLKKILKHSFVKNQIYECVSDRSGNFAKFAKAKIDTTILYSKNGKDFSKKLYTRYGNNFIFLSFYTKLFCGMFLNKNKKKILNLHNTLLPSFPGMQGTKNNISSKYLFGGVTLHYIDKFIDNGEPLFQASINFNKNKSFKINRHRIFMAQYYLILNFFYLLYKNKIQIRNNQIYIKNPKYNFSHFSPNLEKDLFRFLKVKNFFKI